MWQQHHEEEGGAGSAKEPADSSTYVSSINFVKPIGSTTNYWSFIRPPSVSFIYSSIRRDIHIHKHSPTRCGAVSAINNTPSCCVLSLSLSMYLDICQTGRQGIPRLADA
eukprot:GHVU01028993.1.p1 GENE.GHVU01028993.1~~GHVU01028993.1.p1  ORF type:complete len:110 (+),score=4.04 GHVU01028993.1:444-773(+)